MLIDDRLRTELRWEPQHHPPAPPELLDHISARATRRRRTRAFTTTLAAAAAAALLVVGIPKLMAWEHDDSAPVDDPTPSPDSSYSISTSRLDETWEGSPGSKADVLPALGNTGLERFGPTMYDRYFATSMTSAAFYNGTLRWAVGGMRDRQPETVLTGTFEVSGHTLEVRFDDVPGVSTFTWTLSNVRRGERLDLTYVHTTADELFNAPAEVFLRMWSSASLWTPYGTTS